MGHLVSTVGSLHIPLNFNSFNTLNYDETLDYLYAKLPMYQRIGTSAFKKNLTNIISLCEYLGSPEKKFKSIHVAGTNGKGSTSHILSSIYQANGYKTGLYTSPHLIDFRERIKLNGTPCSKAYVIQFTQKIAPIIEKIQPSFFEITVAMAFQFFADQQVDVAIIETGLGGRLDSTNIISPLAAIITSIGLDHMEMLGDTKEKIAREKAGIIKKNTPIILGQIEQPSYEVITAIAQQQHAPIHDFKKEEFLTDLQGLHQQWNIGCAMRCVDVLNSELPTKPSKTNLALRDVRTISNFQGRWQVFHKKPLVIGDVGHNEEGFRMITKEIRKLDKKVHLILGFVQDKNLDLIVPLLPKAKSYHFVKPKVFRGMDPKKAKEHFGNYGINGVAHNNLHAALHTIYPTVPKDELIFVGGSNFIIADLLNLQQNNKLPF